MTGRQISLRVRFSTQALTETVRVRHGATTHIVAARTVTPELAIVQALSDGPYRGAVVPDRFQLARLADGQILTEPLCPGRLAQALWQAVGNPPPPLEPRT